MISEIFRIDQQRDGWRVTWPSKGSVKGNAWRLAEWAAKSIQNPCVAFGSGDRQVTINTELLFLHNPQELMEQIFKTYCIDYIDSVQFNSCSEAENFVNAAEKYIVWKQLSKVNHGN